MPLIHAVIFAIFNRAGTRDTIADVLQRTSDSVYGMPLDKPQARILADRIWRELEFVQK